MTAGEGKGRRWLGVEFEAAADQEDLAGWLMMHCGANGCEISPAGQDRIRLHASFEEAALSDEHLQRLKSSLEEYGLASCLISLRVTAIPEEDWLARWKEGFEPFPVGDKLLICPPWFRDRLSTDLVGHRQVVMIEPGMAFGTGLHATTQFCLRALEQQRIRPNVLDVGTGSGILAIAAALLSPTCSVVALDTDPTSMRLARENVGLNGVGRQVRLAEGSTEIVAGCQFDTILSNLTCEDILALLPEYMDLASEGALIICAGILREKLPMLERALSKYPLDLVQQELGDMWAGLVLRKNP